MVKLLAAARAHKRRTVACKFDFESMWLRGKGILESDSGPDIRIASSSVSPRELSAYDVTAGHRRNAANCVMCDTGLA